MAIKTLRVFQEFTSEGYVPMPPSGNIDYGVTIAGTFPEETPTTFQLDDPDIDVEVTEMTDFYVWIRSHGSEWNINYTRNVRVYPDSPLINNVVMGIIIANLDYTVPYVGATENVDLGEFGLSGGFLHLDNTPTLANVPTTPGTFVWNDAEGTADLLLKGGNVTLQLGQEEVLRVVNKTGATLNEADFRAVRIRSVAEGGAQGQRLAVVLAQGDNDPDSATTIGLVTETIANNQEGFITTGGNVNKINTTGAKSYGGTETWVDGDVLYLSPNHPGYLTKVKPQAPDHTIIIGWVVYAHANNGKIFVKVDNGYELDELHNVKITNPLLDDFLMYDTTLNVWKNKDMHGTKGYIPYYNDTTLFLNSPFWTNGSLVGLGTITPTALLHMKGTTAYTNVILDNNSPTGGGMFSAYQNGAETAMFGTDAYYQTNTSIDAAIAAKKAGGGIQFYTNGSQSEKMGINSDGNVFVGQTPTYVAGATQLIVRGKTGAGFLGVNHYDMSIKGFMNTFNSVFQVGTSTFHSLAFLVEDTERGRVNSSGRLLWGTTTDNGVDIAQFNGSIIATSIKKSGGTSSQYLMADGSVSTLGNFVPTSRTLTINGTSYDLSADRSWTIAASGGTVTSVSATVPTGFAISGSPITTSGTLAITFASGYSLPTTIKQSNWDDAYTWVSNFPSQTGNSGKFLTTNGSTLSWGTVTAGVSSFNTRTGDITLLSSDVTTALGYTPVTNARTLSINGTSYDLSADRAWTISLPSNSRNVSTFTATAGQTTFTISGGYTPNLVDVYVNGARLSASDYVATNGTTVVLNVGVVVNDIVDVVNYIASSVASITGTGTSGYLTKWTGSSFLANSLIYDNGSSVGIGTSTLTSILTINEATYPIITFNSSNVTRGSIGFNGVQGQFNISSDLANPMVFYTNGSERMRIVTTGDIGIGVTNPQSYWSAANRLVVYKSGAENGMTFVGDAAHSATIAFALGISGSNRYRGYIQYYHSTDTMYLGVNASDRVTINSSGNVGIGTTAPTGTYGKLSVAGGISILNDYNAKLEIGRYAGFAPNSYIKLGANSDSLRITNNNDSADIFTITNGGNVGIGTSSISSATNQIVTEIYATSYSTLRLNAGNTLKAELTANNVSNWLFIGTTTNHQVIFGTNDTERMRIASNGKVGIGTSNPTEKFNVYTNELIWAIDIQHGYTASNQYYVAFRNSAGSQTGNIQGNGSSTSYNTTSDYRLKEDLKPIKGLEQVSKINVYDFKFKNSSNRMDGVLAHELQEVLPFAVTGVKDGKDMQSVDYSKIVPVLVQAIKELNAKLEAK